MSRYARPDGRRMAEVRPVSRTVSYQHYGDEETVVAPDPVTGQELLEDCLYLLTHSCNRSGCVGNRTEAIEAGRLASRLAEVTAERDALERLLTRRERGW